MTETDISKVLIEGEYATIMGVKYKRVEEPKPQTLYETLLLKTEYYPKVCGEICDVVEDWLPKEHNTNSYKWNECIRMIKEKLR